MKVTIAPSLFIKLTFLLIAKFFTCLRELILILRVVRGIYVYLV